MLSNMSTEEIFVIAYAWDLVRIDHSLNLYLASSDINFDVSVRGRSKEIHLPDLLGTSSTYMLVLTTTTSTPTQSDHGICSLARPQPSHRPSRHQTRGSFLDIFDSRIIVNVFISAEHLAHPRWTNQDS